MLLSGRQIDKLDIFETHEDVLASFGRRRKNATNTVLINRQRMSEDDVNGVMNSTTSKIVIADSMIPPLSGDSNVGQGVFVQPGQTINRGQIITEYGGEPRWVRKKDIDQIAMRSRYAFCIGPFRIRENMNSNVLSRKQYFCVLDAVDSDKNNLLCCGHMVNTCFPRSPFPYNEPNCVFGIELCKLQLKLYVPPDVRVFIIAGTQLRGGKDLSMNSELSVDYHWELAYSEGLWCHDKNCSQCVQGIHAWSQNRIAQMIADGLIA